jgi:hypothetical protein
MQEEEGKLAAATVVFSQSIQPDHPSLDQGINIRGASQATGDDYPMRVELKHLCDESHVTDRMRTQNGPKDYSCNHQKKNKQQASKITYIRS